jgi:hypothetical protein
MLCNSQQLQDHRSKYEKNKSSLMEMGNKKKGNRTDDELQPYFHEREWLDKIDSDIDTINKNHKKPFALPKKEKQNNSMSYTGNFC